MTDDRASQLEAQTPNDNTTLLEVLYSYEHAGYLGDFSVDDEANVLCHTCQNRANPADIQALSLRRLEGASDPSDMLAIVALSCPVCDTKGLLLVNYGPEASAEQARVLIASMTAGAKDRFPTLKPLTRPKPARPERSLIDVGHE